MRWSHRCFWKSPFANLRHELRKDEGMPRSTDRQTDPAAATASLGAEAALLEGRLSLLREAIDTVDARIDAVSKTLRGLQRSVAEPTDVEVPPGLAGGNGLDHSTTGRA
jgi:hypothetical protein